ncbi:hypothetical protein N5C38_21460 [Pseudomonas chengduensis]|uniref:Uncharacterized protein n=1 Tax=Ectopseudomonas chengduensis TaxID=489632 RepID=A0A1G6TEH3_9GAMM|nr:MULTISPECIES: hypothetical protein [Pseudomonas]MBP3062551.1 hypothetical protein [Pseudomonas chengduensis]MDH0625011.1 hypothetical protein [Pseudomonas chengduensis]MDH1213605.1 hypothetical protein [Pseudomonas chengduensis]MDH1667238.1 hypothetical protein [Pseudomonas chengduensis]MDH1684122.1 hypothetical protein [Pseudomonas chengduensis]
MNKTPLKAQHLLVFVAVAVLFFAWGAWLMRSTEVEPVANLQQWRDVLLQPLAEDELMLREVQAVAPGELWLEPRLDGARLVYRAPLEGEEGEWSLEAELKLSAEQRDSLMTAQGLKAGDSEQALGQSLVDQMAGFSIASLNLSAPQALASDRLAASLGQPRLTLELAEGQAWVYPQWGLTVHLQGDEVELLHAVPRKAFRATR